MELKYTQTNDSKERLDKYISNTVETLSRDKTKQLILGGFVCVNESIVLSPKHTLQDGDEISICMDTIEKDSIVSPWIEGNMPEVIYECEDYLIINKPSGLVVHPGTNNTDHTLVNILLGKDIPLSYKGTIRPGIVHRIDKNTSGVLVIAKNDEFHSYISELFSTGQVDKQYVLISEGKYPTDKGIIDVPIGRHKHNRKLMETTNSNSKPAKSTFIVLEEFKDNDYVEFKIHTGRTHQIRVHSKFIGAPILNDPEYGTSTDDFGQYLHAQQLSFIDRQGNKVTYIAEQPKEFKQKLQELREKQ